MILFIYNMSTYHCIELVDELRKRQRIGYAKVSMCQMVIKYNITVEQRKKFRKGLKKLGFVLITENAASLIIAMKKIISDKILNSEVTYLVPDLQVYIAFQLGYKSKKKAKYLAGRFKYATGVDLQTYIILQKIEFMKILLRYHEYSLEEIMSMLNYSSVQHISEQFFEHTGFTPEGYRLRFSLKKTQK